ncbi:uncharacterized protein LOC117170269 isoform X2 [Belonocnema kinseyi]|uniref:uncharacterized protein LOC117170269 isoform X2 n=1 Tax=Belonocnema kinseyi TaxID=2817044 RepID=UPI00143DCA60|nr:uncharacterized protein LOC117170269 isoform X2 [Belonocnema kinseyi]
MAERLDIERRMREKIYIIDYMEREINGNRLPSNLQVLRVFFYNHRHIKLNVPESAVLVLNEVKIFWTKARLPVQSDQRCLNKIKGLFEKWRILKKSSNRQTEIQQRNDNDFKQLLSELFDISLADVLSRTDVFEEDKQFLILQRENGRKAYIAKVDKSLQEKTGNHEKRIEEEESWRRRVYEEQKHAAVIQF